MVLLTTFLWYYLQHFYKTFLYIFMVLLAPFLWFYLQHFYGITAFLYNIFIVLLTRFFYTFFMVLFTFYTTFQASIFVHSSLLGKFKANTLAVKLLSFVFFRNYGIIPRQLIIRRISAFYTFLQLYKCLWHFITRTNN